MAAPSKPTRKSNRSARGTFYIGALIFSVLTLYLVGYVFSFITRPKVGVETVAYGAVTTSKSADAVIIRREEVINSNADGAATYYCSEEERVKKNTDVLSIKDVAQTSVIEKKIDSLDADIWKMQEKRADITIFKQDIERIDEKIKSIVKSNSYKFVNASIGDVYNFKTQLKKQMELKSDMLLTEQQGSVKSKVEEKLGYENRLQEAISTLQAPVSGIVSFEIDGFENVFTVDKMKGITDEQAKMDIKKEPSILNKPIVKGTPAFKVVASNVWYMAAYMKNEQLEGLEEGNAVTLLAEGKGQKKEITAKVYYIRGGEQESFIIFETNQFMTDFLSTRKTNITIKKAETKGIEVPKTAIVEKNLYKVPRSFLTNENKLLTSNNGEDVMADVLITEEEYCYVLVTTGSLKLGDQIANHEQSGQPVFTIDEMKTVQGVYVVNSSIAVFKMIGEPLYESVETIIAAPSNRGLKVFDKIISDAKNAENKQRMY